MATGEVRDAIREVREIHRRVIESRGFRGYSGRARAISGTLALAAAAAMAWGAVPRTPAAHLIGWGAVCAAALLLNYGALALWLRSDPQVRRDVRHLLPTVYPLPAIAAGGVLSAVFIANGHYQYLFGTWMLFFGLANLSSRQFLPRIIWPLGLYYLACGAAALLLPARASLDPWLMGIVFFAGEWAGGLAFFFHRSPGASLGDFFYLRRRPE